MHCMHRRLSKTNAEVISAVLMISVQLSQLKLTGTVYASCVFHRDAKSLVFVGL